MSGIFGGGGGDGGRAAERQIKAQQAENERMRAENEAEKARVEEENEARKRARMRGGSRMLLSAARVNPEEGVTTLGSVGGQ